MKRLGAGRGSAMLRDVTPGILAGGQGTRLRPITNVKRPKPFLKLFSNQSLLQDTVLRSRPMGDPVVIVHRDYAERARADLDALGAGGHVICEPAGRSTAPAIALAALLLRDENKPMLIMPSDHYIHDPAQFHSAAALAYEALKSGSSGAAILGVPARAPDARYGYIQIDEGGNVRRFIEKPDRPLAKDLIADGRCFWNTGMFMMRPRDYLAALKKFEPDIYDLCLRCFEGGRHEKSFLFVKSDIYSKIKGLAVDHAIMERLPSAGRKIHLAVLHGYWQDVGCFSALIRAKVKSLIN